jgi:hypothetical protein
MPRKSNPVGMTPSGWSARYPAILPIESGAMKVPPPWGLMSVKRGTTSWDVTCQPHVGSYEAEADQCLFWAIQELCLSVDRRGPDRCVQYPAYIRGGRTSTSQRGPYRSSPPTRRTHITVAVPTLQRLWVGRCFPDILGLAKIDDQPVAT